MKFSGFLILTFIACTDLLAQCPASDGSDLFDIGGSPSFVISSACVVNTSSSLFPNADIDIQTGGSLTINFTGGGAKIYDQIGGSITLRGDGAGGSVDGVFTINDASFSIEDASVAIEDGALFDVTGTSPNGNVSIGFFGSGSTTTLALDGNLNINGDLTLNNASVLTGGGNINVNDITDNGTNDAGFVGTVNCGGTCAALPVELTQFVAVINNESVLLEWTTASELNNLGFEIEKSLNGVDFEMIDFVSGFGTKNEESKYSFQDYGSLSYSIIYYRLKQIDFDGNYEYSSIVNVRNTEINSSVVLYPSVVYDEVSLSGNDQMLYQAIVYDISGNVHLSITESTSLVTIQQLLNSKIKSLPSSIYLLKVLSEGNDQVLKFIKR